MPAKHDSKRAKTDALLEEGTLNPTPEKVRDPKFQESEFFDPRDAVQVKYEMLRRVSIENASVTEASDEYGISRPTYYQAKANFDAAGIAGLVPKRPGPRGPPQGPWRGPGVRAGTAGPRRAGSRSRACEVDPQRIRHQGSSQDDRASIKKNCRMNTQRCRRVRSLSIAAQYEVLRMAGLGEALPPTARSGLMLFLRRGMWGWAQALAAASHVPQQSAIAYSTSAA